MTTQTVAFVPVFTVGDRLRKAREHLGMSQAEFALLTGISRRSISSYESGEAHPKRPVLFTWAAHTGVSMQWIETGVGSNPDDGGAGQQPSGYRLVAFPKQRRPRVLDAA